MRKILILLYILIPYCCFAQFFDDFSNTVSFQKNNWQGDLSHFKLEDKALRLSNPTSITDNYKSMLAAPVNFKNIQTWEIEATLNFNPSIYNHACFYLATNSSDLKSNPDGIYLQLGGKEDEIKLIQQQGDKTETLLHIPKRLTQSSYNQIALKVVCQQGKWQLFSQLYDEEEYRKEGETDIVSLPEKGYIGWLCNYTKTNASKFYLHRVHLSDQALTEDTTDLEDTDDSNPDEDNDDDIYIEEEITPSENPLYGEIIISEIMANPKGATGLPEAEYVELHNRSAKPLSLNGCTFYYGTKKFELDDYTLAPGGFVILCNANNTSLFGSQLPILPVTSFPVLANTGKLLYLENQEGELLHWIEYSDSWYGSSSLKNGGYALEMVDTNILSSTPQNWKASKASSGGTPGATNSITASKSDPTTPYLKGHALSSKSALLLYFSKSIHPEALQEILRNNDLEDIRLTATDYPYNQSFSIQLPSHIITDYLTLSLSNLTCIDNASLLDCGMIQFGSAYTAEPNDCVINELLWRPAEENEPFIELLNISDQILDLSQLYIATLGPDSLPTNKYPLCSNPTWLEPDKLAIVTTHPLSVFQKYGYHDQPRIIEIASFPELPKAGGNIALFTNQDHLIERFDYHTRLHLSTLNDLSGVSLERRDPLMAASIAGNWASGHQSTGFATPGYANYADKEIATDDIHLSENEQFRIVPEYLSLQEESAHAHLSLFYKMNEEGTQLTATLFTSNGLRVCRLVTNLTLEAEGDICWESEWRNNRSSSPGIYLLLLEYVTPSGKTGKEKIALPIVP